MWLQWGWLHPADGSQVYKQAASSGSYHGGQWLRARQWNDGSGAGVFSLIGTLQRESVTMGGQLTGGQLFSMRREMHELDSACVDGVLGLGDGFRVRRIGRLECSDEMAGSNASSACSGHDHG
jgi:hypothetical protein